MANLGYLQLTRECKQFCRFCSNPPSGVDLTETEMKGLIEDLVERGYDGVILTGGEPTIAPLLLPAIQYARQKNLHVRMITNGQRVSNLAFLKELQNAGLNHLHLSFHSSRPEVHDFVTQTPGAWKAIVQAMENCRDLGIQNDINTVINAYNSDHLHETVMWLGTNFPHIHHFVWNNMDPNMNRAERNPDVIPRLREFELSLHLAMTFLASQGRSFRVERVPLCYMRGFEHCSTETRKIIKLKKTSIKIKTLIL